MESHGIMTRRTIDWVPIGNRLVRNHLEWDPEETIEDSSDVHTVVVDGNPVGVLRMAVDDILTALSVLNLNLPVWVGIPSSCPCPCPCACSSCCLFLFTSFFFVFSCCDIWWYFVCFFFQSSSSALFLFLLLIFFLLHFPSAWCASFATRNVGQPWVMSEMSAAAGSRWVWVKIRYPKIMDG